MSAKKPLFQVDHPLTGVNVNRTYKTELSRLQGNILKSHGREAAVNLFLTFQPGKQAEAKHFLRKFAREVTSAVKQRAQTQRFKKTRKAELFATLYLSAKGYKYLGLPTAGFSAEFRTGMMTAAAKLDDPPVQQWETKFQKDIHVMVLLAHDEVPVLTQTLSQLRDRVTKFAQVSSEFGIAIHDGAGRVIEHFGYVDGRSQPLFFQEEANQQPRKHWDPTAGPSLVLVKDPLGSSNADCGTYYVFRKLEQNVKGFKAREQGLADALQLTGDARELAGAMVIGRFEDGTPVVLRQQAAAKPKPINDFAYPAADPAGNKCPFLGHIRKTNPRGDSIPSGATLDQEKARRIARRGITYGDPTPPGDDLDALPEAGVGLLFQCCQADISKQFEFLQHTGADNDNFARPSTGKDGVIGQSAAGSFPDLHFPNPWGSAGRTPFSFHSFVLMKGGEYFFAPSISFLRKLKGA
jgi:Dyp-type peroxidase family